MDIDKIFNTEIMQKDEKVFNDVIKNDMSLDDKRKMYNKVKDENEVLTYILNNYKDELFRKNIGVIILSKDLKDFIRHSIVDYYLLTLLEQFLPSGNFQKFEDFVYMLEKDLFAPNQETLSQFTSKDDMIYVYYNNTLNKIIIVDHIMYLKALMEYVKEEKEFYENVSIEFEKEVKKYLVEKNFK